MYSSYSKSTMGYSNTAGQIKQMVVSVDVKSRYSWNTTLPFEFKLKIPRSRKGSIITTRSLQMKQAENYENWLMNSSGHFGPWLLVPIFCVTVIMTMGKRVTNLAEAIWSLYFTYESTKKKVSV